MQWALRNLITTNGLNSAVLVASGVPISEVEHAPAKEKEKEKMKEKVTTQPASSHDEVPSRPPPPPRPPTVARQGTDGSEAEAKAILPLPAQMGPATAGIGLTIWSKTGRAW